MIHTTGLKSSYILLETVNKKANIYKVRWGYMDKKYIDPETEQEVDTPYATWVEEIIYYKPMLSALRDMINNFYNVITDDKILKGFEWNSQPVWLSEENQRNYKATYDIAFQTNGANLPVKFKFGTDEEPYYHEFNTLEELQTFYLSAVYFIQSCYQEGWVKKDAVDYSAYEQALNNL